jgi:hypothetical protein
MVIVDRGSEFSVRVSGRRTLTFFIGISVAPPVADRKEEQK